LQAAKQFQEVFDFLSEEVKSKPDDVEILWRLARANYELGEIASDKTVKQEYFTEAHKLAAKCLELDEKNAMSHKWVAITTSGLGDFLSTKEKIGNSFKIKEHALKALELKPTDPTICHLLGRWCYAVANIGWVDRKLAAALFATPPTSTFEEALGYLQKAEQLQPNFLRNAVWIGDTYTSLKQYDKAREAYKCAVEMPYTGDVETALHNDAVAKAKK